MSVLRTSYSCTSPSYLTAMRISVSKRPSTRLALDTSSNQFPPACLGCAQLHFPPFFLQEGFLHNNAGLRSAEHLLPCCHLLDECKTVRCLGEQGCQCVAVSVIETPKYADVLLLIGAPERYHSLHVSGHVCVTTRSILVALGMCYVEPSALPTH